MSEVKRYSDKEIAASVRDDICPEQGGVPIGAYVFASDHDVEVARLTEQLRTARDDALNDVLAKIAFDRATLKHSHPSLIGGLRRATMLTEELKKPRDGKHE